MTTDNQEHHDQPNASSEDDATGRVAGMSRLLPFTDDPTRHIIVAALQHRPNATASARDRLNAAIDSAGLRPPRGYRRPSAAPLNVLAPRVAHAIDYLRDDKLAGAVFDVWREADSDLAEAVAAYLREHELDVLGPKREVFTEFLQMEEISMSSAVIGSQNPDAHFDLDLIAVMYSYLSGAFPYESQFVSESIPKWLDELRELPEDAPEWQDITKFIGKLSELSVERERSLHDARVERLFETLDSIREEFPEQLAYLEIELPTNESEGLAGRRRVGPAQELADKVREAVAGFAAVLEPGPTRSAERERAADRDRLGDECVALAQELRDLAEAASDAPPEEEEEDAAEESSAASERHAAEKAELEAEIERLRKEAADAAAQLAESEKARAQAQADLATREQSYQNLLMQKETEAEENSDLKRQLQELGAAVESLRSGLRPYVAENAEELGVDSVPGAIDLARQMYEPDSVVIALNSRSWAETPYKRPIEVYHALEWLATEYRDLHRNPIGADPEFDRRLKEKCNGWLYSPKQSMTAKGKYPEEYVTTVDGKTYTLDEHIGEGTRGDPRNMIRIAFAWDAAMEKVVVGYVGPHQQTDRT